MKGRLAEGTRSMYYKKDRLNISDACCRSLVPRLPDLVNLEKIEEPGDEASISVQYTI